MAKPSTYVVDKDNVVHFRYCSMGQSYAGHDKTTAAEMLAGITKGDSQNFFGGNNAGPSILSVCGDCVVPDALEEAVEL